MKKILSLFLTVLMVLSIASVGFAKSPIGVSAEGWNGWTGNATTETNPITESGMVVKVNGTATLDPAMRFEGVMALTAEVYAPNGGSISLKNSKGQSAATLTLANGVINGSETAYSTEAWTTYKLFVMTGTKSYQVYTTAGGVDTFVCNGTVDDIIAPTKIEFTGIEMYVGKVTLDEMEKARPYPDYELTTVYEMNMSDFSEGLVKGKYNGVNWLNNRTTETTYVDTKKTEDTSDDITYQSRTSFVKGNYYGADAIRAKNTGADVEGVTYTTETNELTMYKTVSGNVVYDLKLYIPTTVDDGVANKAELMLNTRDTSGIMLVKLSAENGLFAGPVFNYDRHIDLPKDKWFDLKLEILREMQGMNIYIDGVKMNEWVVELDNTDGIGDLTRFPFVLTNAKEYAGEIYFRDLKLSTVSSTGGVVTRTLLEEGFDTASTAAAGGTEQFVYTDGYTTTETAADQNMKLDSGVTAYDRSGVGKLKKYEKANYSGTTYTNIIVSEDADSTLKGVEALKPYEDTTIPEAANDGVNSLPDARYYNQTPIDLTGADEVTVTFDFYSPGISRRVTNSNSTTVMDDRLTVYLTDEAVKDAVLSSANSHPYIEVSNRVTLSDMSVATTSTGASVNIREKTSYSAFKAWKSFELTLRPGVELASSSVVYKPFKIAGSEISGNTKTKVPTRDGLTRDVFESLKYLSLGVNGQTGGLFYLDNLKVVSTTKLGEDYVKGYYVATELRSFESDLTRDEIKELEYAEVRFTDGKLVDGLPSEIYKTIDRIIIKENREVADDAKVIIGVYKGDALETAKALDYEEDGIYDVSSENISVDADSRVRVFYWSMGGLNPIDTFDAIDKNTERVNLWVLGSSSAAHDGDEITGKEGWGDFLSEYLNTNKICIRNVAVSGSAVKSLVDASGQPGSLYDELFGANGKIQKGDYVLLSHGANDAKIENEGKYATPYGTGEGTWQWYVQKKLIDVIENIGATPILVTNSIRCVYKDTAAEGEDPNYVFYDEPNRIEYSRAMDVLAEVNDIGLVDLHGMQADHLGSISYEEALTEFCNTTAGKTDTSHTNIKGAKLKAGFICKGLKLLGIEGLSEYMK